MEHQNHTETPETIANMDHSNMNHGAMQHSGNPAMGHTGHDHIAMINDFKKRFYAVLALTIPIMLLSTMIQKFMGVNWQFAGSSYILFVLSSVVFFLWGMAILERIG